MKILANRKIKALFCKIVACILVFALISVSFIVFGVHDAALYILLFAVCAFFGVKGYQMYKRAVEEQPINERVWIWTFYLMHNVHSFTENGQKKTETSE